MQSNKKMKKKIGELRRNQLITSMGAGAIVDFKDSSAIISGINEWINRDEIEYEKFKFNNKRLESLLGVDYFMAPPFFSEPMKHKVSQDILAYRFPQWGYCPACRKLGKFTEFKKDRGRYKCYCNGRTEIIPSRFVVACEKGHIDDFPYREWAHNGFTDCNKQLYIRENGYTGELKSINIQCDCGASRNLGEIFNEKFELKCTGKSPWLGEHYSECTEKMKTLQRSSSSVYYPITVNTIVIPPWSTKVIKDIEKLWDFLKDDDMPKEKFIEKIASNNNVPEEYVKKLIERMKRDEENVTWEEIIEDEYRALNIEKNEKDFVTVEEEVPEFINKYIDKVFLVKKMTEIIVNIGFKRVIPNYDITDSTTYSRISKKINQEWLPGITQKGEGIFIKINEQKLREWENNPEIINRYKNITDKKNEGYLKSLRKPIVPRTILLHTLAHAIIKQLTFECGYSASSIKERLYVSLEKGEIDMSGILIYTSSSDSDGSLGGLVKQGQKKNFDNILRKTINSLTWCSSDPLCIESEEHGYKNLNLAACHACTLLPETSCELRNILIDRASIRGTLNDKQIGFFNEFYNKEEK